MSTQTVVSFDFDDTLSEGWSTGYGGSGLVCIPEYLELLKEYHALGCKVLVITARMRSKENLKEIELFLDSYGVRGMVEKIIFTNLKLKGEYAYKEGVSLHYDDDIGQLKSVKEYGIEVVCSKPEQLLASTL